MGRSASQISAILGDCTRNAVLSKAIRMGLSDRGRNEASVPATIRIKPRAVDDSPISEAATFTLAISSAVTWVTPLPINHRCKWPIGDPGVEGFRFCNAEASVGEDGSERPYCQRHWRKGHLVMTTDAKDLVRALRKYL